jgi:hypothetical protein
MARLAYLTEPVPGEFILNVQVEQPDLQRYRISLDHLSNIVVDGAKMALTRRKAS